MDQMDLNTVQYKLHTRLDSGAWLICTVSNAGYKQAEVQIRVRGFYSPFPMSCACPSYGATRICTCVKGNCAPSRGGGTGLYIMANSKFIMVSSQITNFLHGYYSCVGNSIYPGLKPMYHIYRLSFNFYKMLALHICMTRVTSPFGAWKCSIQAIPDREVMSA